MSNAIESARTPWHLWLVGVLATLWNSIGAVDIVATLTDYRPYLEGAGLSPTEIAFFQSYPFWHNLLWAVGTWGGFIGSILLLFRSRFAVPVLGASLVGAVVAMSRTMMLDNAPPSAKELTFPIIIWVIAAALLGYALWSRRRGVLR